MSTSRAVTGILVFLLLQCGSASAESDNGMIADLKSSFTPANPTVSLKYLVTYRFLFITLSRMAEVKIRATDGHWKPDDKSDPVKATFIEFTFDSLDNPESGKRGRMSIHNRIITVMTMPELEPIVYLKDTDEIINPLFGHEVIAKYREVYDFRSGKLDFSREDQINSTVQTNLVGEFDLTGQGKEIPTVLTLMSKVYHGKKNGIDRDDNTRIFVNIDGMITPFILTAGEKLRDVELLDTKLKAVKVRIEPAPDAEGRGRPLSLWATSYLDLAKSRNSPRMIENALGAPEWNMVPLIADYSLAIGYVRGYITDVAVNDEWP